MNIREYNQEFLPKINHASSFINNIEHAMQKTNDYNEAMRQLNIIGLSDETRDTIKTALECYRKSVLEKEVNKPYK